MPQRIKVKNSSVEGKAPDAADLQVAELALNVADKKLYSKDVAGNVFEIGITDIPSLDFVELNDGGTQQTIIGGGGLDIAGGVTSEFGTNAAQLGNIAPLNDWSVYPERSTTLTAPELRPPFIEGRFSGTAVVLSEGE